MIPNTLNILIYFKMGTSIQLSFDLGPKSFLEDWTCWLGLTLTFLHKKKCNAKCFMVYSLLLFKGDTNSNILVVYYKWNSLLIFFPQTFVLVSLILKYIYTHSVSVFSCLINYPWQNETHLIEASMCMHMFQMVGPEVCTNFIGDISVHWKLLSLLLLYFT